MEQMRPPQNGLRPVPARPGLIPQRLLAEYVALGEQVRRRRELQRHLMAMLMAGAGVEPGPYTAGVRTVLSRRLSVAKLSDLIGPENVQLFLEAIEPTESRQLDVREATAHGARPGGRANPAAGRRRGPGEALDIS